MLFEDVFVSLSFFYKYFIIMGDINSRTGQLKDTFKTDTIVKELKEYREDFDDFHISRKSRDKEITLWGRRLIDFVKYTVYI